MKKVLKKLLICICLFLTLFNFIMLDSNYVYADQKQEFMDDVGNIFSGLGSTIVSLLSGVVGVLTWVQRLPLALAPMLVQGGVTLVANIGGMTPTPGGGSLITPYEILFNHLNLTSIDFFELSGTGPVITIRSQVVKWYYIMRIIAIAILLAILIFVGIRMTITTIASEKAIYKKALFDWATSLALVFFLHYLIRAILWINTGLVTILEHIAGSAGTTAGNLSTYLKTITDLVFDADFLVAVTAIIISIFISIQTIMFLINYIKRMITLAFLIIISPLITITYSIDKMGDQKAQALNTWLKDFIFTILVQPFHCILYLVFVDSAISIISSGSGNIGASLLAILCIKFVWDGEKIVRKIFGFEGSSSLATAAASGAVVGSMLSKAKSAASTAKSGIKFAKNTKTGKMIGNKINAKKENIKESVQKKVDEFSEKRKTKKESNKQKSKIRELAAKVENTGVLRNIKNHATSFKNSEFGQALGSDSKRFMRSLVDPGKIAKFTAGTAIAAAMYALPDSNILTAAGAGMAAGKSAETSVKRMQDNKKERFEENILKAWNTHCDINGGDRNSKERFDDWYKSTYQNGKVLNDYSQKNMGKERENAVKNLQENVGVKKEDLADIIAKLQRAILAREPYDPSKLFSGYRNEEGGIEADHIAAAVTAYASKFNESIVYQNATDYNAQMNRYDITADDAIEGITDREFKEQTSVTPPETPITPPETPVITTEEETKVSTVEQMENEKFDLVSESEEVKDVNETFGESEDMNAIYSTLDKTIKENIKNVEDGIKNNLGSIGKDQEEQLKEVMGIIESSVKNINPNSGTLESQINKIAQKALSGLSIPENKSEQIRGQLVQYTQKQVVQNYVTNTYKGANSKLDGAKLKQDLEKIAKKNK